MPDVYAAPPSLSLTVVTERIRPKSRVLELAPAYFEQTLQQEEAKQRLAGNPLRRALLAFVR
jgi:hypothetical protein